MGFGLQWNDAIGLVCYGVGIPIEWLHEVVV